MSRRPQVPARAMRAAVRGLVRPVLGPRMPVSVSVQRRWLELVTGLTPLCDGVDVRPGDLGGRRAEVLVPRGGSSGSVRARAAGVPVELRRLDGMWHVAHASAGMVANSTAAVTALGEAMAPRLGRLSAAS